MSLISLLVPEVASAWRTDVAATPGGSRPWAVATDSAHDVLVGGRLQSPDGDNDALVVKLAATDGSELWRHVTAGSGGAGDVVRALALAANDDVFAFGQVQTGGSAGDALIARLAAGDGTPVWERQLDGGQGLDDALNDGARTAAGDAVAAGQSVDTGVDGKATVWLLDGTMGGPQWTAQVGGTGGVAQRVAAADGAIYVAAEVPGASGTELVVAKLDEASGTPLWTQTLAGSGAADDAIGDLVVRPPDRVLVAVTLHDAPTAPDLVVVALAPATGAELWRARLDGSATDAADEDAAAALALAPDGDVVVAGTLSDATDRNDLAVAKLAAADGGELWRTLVDGSGGGNNDLADDVAVDAAGNVVAVGRLRSSGTGADLAVVALAGVDGGERWRVLVDSGGGGGDRARAVAIDGAGHVAVAGQLNDGDSTSDSLVALKLAGATGGDYPCGDGLLDEGEACDDANTVVGDGCRPDCTVEACGDGILDPQEGCDDGNVEDGDCCSAGCAADPDGTACDDGDACTTVDVCQAGACAGGSPVVCAPMACRIVSCNPADGTCLSVPTVDGGGCDDGDLCTTLDRCMGGTCVGEQPRFCDDYDACTDDTCDPLAGCVATPREGFASVECVFERERLGIVCPTDLPAGVAKKLARAHGLVEKAAGAEKPGKARRRLKQAAKQARAAARKAGKRKSPLALACSQAIAEEMEELRARIDALREALRS